MSRCRRSGALLASVDDRICGPSSHPPHDHCAVGFGGDLPSRRGVIRAEMALYDSCRPRQPTSTRLIGARVVEHHAATLRHELNPAGPVELAASLGVVAVDEYQVHLALPVLGHLVGEGNVPVNLRCIRTTPA